MTQGRAVGGGGGHFEIMMLPEDNGGSGQLSKTCVGLDNIHCKTIARVNLFNFAIHCKEISLSGAFNAKKNYTLKIFLF
jgi:hypothetical protein